MSDGFLDVTPIPDVGVSVPVIASGVTVNVIESGSIDDDAYFHNPSIAQVTSTNIDVSGGTVRVVTPEMRQSRATITSATDKYYKGSPTSTTNQFETIGMKNVNMVPGNDYTFIDEYAAVPTIQGSTRKYEFMISYLNGSNVPGIIKSPVSDAQGATTAVTGSVAAWNSGVSVFTASSNPSWVADSIIGHAVQFFDSSDNFLYEGVAYDNTSDTISCYFVADPNASGAFSNGGVTTVAKIKIPDSYEIFEVGSDGKGVSFDGINDLKDYIETTNLSGTLSGTSYRLSWDNMYNKTAGNYSDAQGNSSVAVSAASFNNVSHYGIFMFVSDGTSGPTNEYPIGNDGTDDTADGSDQNGQWYFVEDILAPRTSAPSTVTYDLEVPAGKSVAIWVGVRTTTTETSATNTSRQVPNITPGAGGGGSVS